VRGGKGANTPSPKFLLPKNNFLTAELKRNKIIGVTVEERSVCILRAGSNQSSPSF
jgi:hypothetical protein